MEQECPGCKTKNIQEEIFCIDCGLKLSPSPVLRQTAPDEKQDAYGNGIMILPEGTVLKKTYKVNYLTAGGMGAIYLATHIKTKDEFIIKEAYSSDYKKREEFIIALTKERETIIRLNHPGIVKSIDYFSENDAYYLVIEYIKGESLEQYQSKITINEIDEHKVIEWAIELCNILSYIHNLTPPLIYRDLKPGNILLTEDEKIKLIDFGIARIFKEDLTRDTMAFGTQGFAAPEQYGTSQTDKRSDIYSLGATLHYLLTGRDPRDSQNLFIFPSVRDINPQISEGLQEVISRATQIDQEKRYNSAEEMAEALKKLRQKLLVKPGFLNLGEIKSGTKKNVTLKIINTGKIVISGEIHLPDSFPGLKVDKKTFSGEETINIQIDTYLLNSDEIYKDNIVITSTGGNSYIPISFKVVKDINNQNDLEATVVKGDHQWKTRIVDISPAPKEKEEEIENKNIIILEFIKKHWKLIPILLVSFFVFIGVIILLFQSYEKNILKEKYVNLLKGCKISFIAESDIPEAQGSYDIFSMNPNGTGVKNLTENVSWDCNPSWSSVNNKIAFATNRNGFYKIYVMNGDGANVVRLTRDVIDGTCPSWSPDGEKVAFQCFLNDNYEICTINSDGRRMVNLTRNINGDFAPSWSSDGNYIAFESKRDKVKDQSGIITREIYIMNSDGTGQVRLTKNSYDDFSPSWSPDGKKVAFITDENKNYVLNIINRDGSKLTRLIDSEEQKNYPLWSPGGEILLYGCYKKSIIEKTFSLNGKWVIYAINPSKIKPLMLINFGGKQISIRFPLQQNKK